MSKKRGSSVTVDDVCEASKALSDKVNQGKTDATILFVDLVGSTQMKVAKGVTPEAWLANLARIMTRLADLVNSRGGEVVKFIGDEVMALFRRDGGASSACACARDILAEAENLSILCGLTVEFKISADHGSVWMLRYGSGPEDPQGPIVDRCARLVAIAQPSTFLITQDCHQALPPRDGEAFHEMGEYRFRGLATPTTVFRFVEDWEAALRSPVGGPAGFWFRGLRPNAGARDVVRERWFNDLRGARRVTFVGLSHTSLRGYLRELLASLRGREPLPLREIDIYYARSALGNLWESDFQANVLTSLAGCAAELTSKRRRPALKNLRRVGFHQMSVTCLQGGSFIKLSADPGKRPFSIAYVVQHLPRRDTKAAFTIRASARGGRADEVDFIDTHVRMHEQEVARSRQTIIEFSGDALLDPWGESADAWDAFQQSFPVYGESLRALLEFGDVSAEHHVLDLGAGTGRAWDSVLESRTRPASIALLDRSPQMVERASRNLRSHACIVGDAESPFLLPDQPSQFDRVVIHHALQDVFHGKGLEAVARRWAKVLAADGKLLVALNVSPPMHPDPLRRALLAELRSQGKEALWKRRRRAPISKLAEVPKLLRQAGFTVRSKTLRMQRSMKDRLAMWKAPGILDSAVNVATLGGADAARELLDKVAPKVEGRGTDPMVVRLLKCELR